MNYLKARGVLNGVYSGAIVLSDEKAIDGLNHGRIET